MKNKDKLFIGDLNYIFPDFLMYPTVLIMPSHSCKFYPSSQWLLFLYNPCILPPPAKILACSVFPISGEKVSKDPVYSLSYNPFYLYHFIDWFL